MRSRRAERGHLEGLGAGLVFRAYSGYPINETTGVDTNGDGTNNNDRPMAGRDDARQCRFFSRLSTREALPSGNGLQGEKKGSF